MRVNITQIREMKGRGEKIAMLTAYDYSTAKIVDEVGVPLILVGDSLGMVVLGYETPIPVTMDVMMSVLRTLCATRPGSFRRLAARPSNWRAASP
jgi:ketopantoate hydroxymethyltransferase